MEKQQRALFEEIAAESDFAIVQMEVDQDHIHCLVKSEPRIAPLAMVRKLKQESIVHLWKSYGNDLKRHFEGENIKTGAGRYQQAIMAVVGLSDAYLCFLLQSQINGLLLLRMMHGSKKPFLEQARPFIAMLVDYLQKDADSKAEYPVIVRDAERHEAK